MVTKSQWTKNLSPSPSADRQNQLIVELSENSPFRLTKTRSEAIFWSPFFQKFAARVPPRGPEGPPGFPHGGPGAPKGPLGPPRGPEGPPHWPLGPPWDPWARGAARRRSRKARDDLHTRSGLKRHRHGKVVGWRCRRSRLSQNNRPNILATGSNKQILSL